MALLKEINRSVFSSDPNSSLKTKSTRGFKCIMRVGL